MSTDNDARDSREVDRDELPKWWDSGLTQAIYSDDHSVELVGNDGFVQVVIDGVPMFTDDMGYASEIFNIGEPNNYYQYLTDDGLAKLSEVNDGE